MCLFRCLKKGKRREEIVEDEKIFFLSFLCLFELTYLHIIFVNMLVAPFFNCCLLSPCLLLTPFVVVAKLIYIDVYVFIIYFPLITTFSSFSLSSRNFQLHNQKETIFCFLILETKFGIPTAHSAQKKN